MELKKGQKVKILDLTASEQITIKTAVTLSAGEADITCFGVDDAGKLSDDRYFIFYNQLNSPNGAISMKTDPSGTSFSINLAQLPASIHKLVLTVATNESSGMKNIVSGECSIGSGGDKAAEYHFSGDCFDQEKALILCELYRKDNIWRLSVVASGFNGGLSALLAHFGGEEIKQQQPVQPIAPPEPVPEPPKPASSINLKKSGDTHKINLTKNSSEIHVNLNWNNSKKLFGGNAVDLDLACMYRLKDGKKGVIQALGKSFGSADCPPYILLDQDDRTGNSKNGENMYFKKPELLDFAVVFAYIYEGVPNWAKTDAKVILKQQNSPDILIEIDNSNSCDRFCVIASLSGSEGHLEVKREEQYFSGHQAVDKAYQFGFQWRAARK